MKKVIKTLFIAIFIYNTLPYIVSAIENSNEVVAIVNEDLITSVDLKKKAALVKKLTGISKNLSSDKVFKQHIIQTLVDEALIKQQAKKLGINLSDEEFEHFMTSIANQNNFKTPNDMVKALNVNKSELYKQMRIQFLLKKIIAQELEPKITVSTKEVNNNKKISLKDQSKKINTKLLLSEIVIYKEPNNIQNTQNMIKKLYNELTTGVQFEKLASEFSQSNTSANNGLIGWIDSQQLSEDFFNAVNTLKVGQVSNPIETEDSFIILKLNDKKIINNKTNQTKSLSKDQLQNLLYNRKLNLSLMHMFENWKKSSFIEIKGNN